MIYLVGVLVGLLAFLLISPVRTRRGEASQRLEQMYSVDQVRSLDEMDPASFDYRLASSGIHLQPATFRMINLALVIAATLITWPFLPGIPALAIGGLAYYVPNAWLADRAKSRGRQIDKYLPVAVGRIAAGLLAGGGVQDVLEEVGKSLEVEGPNPLSPELLLTAAELRSKDRRETLRHLAKRSPSVSLSNLAYLLEGYLDAGGGKYTQVLADIATRVQQILVARNRTQAKAGDAMVSAKVIPAVLALVLLFLSSDPLVTQSFRALPVQIALGGTIVAMTVGYFLMRSMVMEAV